MRRRFIVFLLLCMPLAAPHAESVSDWFQTTTAHLESVLRIPAQPVTCSSSKLALIPVESSSFIPAGVVSNLLYAYRPITSGLFGSNKYKEANGEFAAKYDVRWMLQRFRALDISDRIPQVFQFDSSGIMVTHEKSLHSLVYYFEVT